MNFGQPNVEIGREMANGQLLFLALVHMHRMYVMYNYVVELNYIATYVIYCAKTSHLLTKI